jgi:hypothetical protein
MKICPLEHKDVYKKFAKELRSSRVAIKKEDTKTEYLGYYLNDNLVGVVGYQKINDKHIRLKTDFVRLQYRGRKIYSDLWESRINRILLYKPDVLSAYCTEMSLPKYLKSGFEVQSVGKNGITYVKLNIKQ